MKKTVLITGAAGFIGSHLCDFLLNKDYKVIGLDNLLTGDYKNIKNFENNKDFTFYKKDVCLKINLEEKVNYILHLASPASPFDYLKYPIQTLKVGSNGTENILELGRINKAVVLVASTSEIYGDPLVHPQPEHYFGNVNPVGPRSVYDEAKRYLEAISTAYKNKYSMDIKIVRIFNTYGPKMRKNDGRAIPTFINQSITNKNFTVFGNGEQTRSFCYIDDTVRGIYKLMLSSYQDPINIGSPRENTLLEIIELIKKINPSRSKIEFKPLPEDDPKMRKPDIKLANTILNWSPKIKLEDGLKNTFDYFLNSF